MGKGKCVDKNGKGYKSIGYYHVEAPTSEWEVEECMQRCQEKSYTSNVLASLVGFDVDNLSDPNYKWCTCYVSTSIYETPSGSCSRYDAQRCDLSAVPTGTGFVAGVDQAASHLYCFAWQEMSSYTRRALHNDDANDVSSDIHKSPSVKLPPDEHGSSRNLRSISAAGAATMEGKPRRRQQQQQLRALQQQQGPPNTTPATIRGEGVATVTFGRRVYRRNLKTGEEGWHWRQEGTRQLQIGATAGQFGMELTIYTSNYGYQEDSSALSQSFGVAVSILSALAGSFLIMI